MLTWCWQWSQTMVQRNNDFSEVDPFLKEDCAHCSCNYDFYFFWNVNLMLNQEKMRDLAEKLFNTRCGVMVEKVNKHLHILNMDTSRRHLSMTDTPSNIIFPGGYCPCGAKVSVWGRHRLHQVHLCQVQRARSQVIPYHHRINYFGNLFWI